MTSGGSALPRHRKAFHSRDLGAATGLQPSNALWLPAAFSGRLWRCCVSPVFFNKSGAKFENQGYLHRTGKTKAPASGGVRLGWDGIPNGDSHPTSFGLNFILRDRFQPAAPALLPTVGVSLPPLPGRLMAWRWQCLARHAVVACPGVLRQVPSVRSPCVSVGCGFNLCRRGEGCPTAAISCRTVASAAPSPCASSSC